MRRSANQRIRRTIPVLIAAWTFYGGFPVCTQAQVVYEVIDLGTVRGHFAAALSINDAGQIVGWDDASIPEPGPEPWPSPRATLFDPTGAGNNIDLGTLGGGVSEAHSINNAGQIVGQAYDSQGDRRATLFDPSGAGNNIDLGTLGGEDSEATSINYAGQIVGEADNTQGWRRATLFDPTGRGNNVDLGTLGGEGSEATCINDAGQIVGAADNTQGRQRATLFDPTGAGNNVDLGTLGGTSSYAYSINNVGRIVGWAENSQLDRRATLFDPTGAGNNIDLGTLGGDESGANCINDAGQILGWESRGWCNATLFDATGASNNIGLCTLMDPASDWGPGEAHDINNSGWIVGLGMNAQGEIHAILLVPKYSGGSGTAEDPYQIATAEDLMQLGETPEDYDKHFILTADIDLDPNLPGRKVFDRAVIAPDTNDATWEFEGTPFTGVFDGNGHKVSHLTIKGLRRLGLFGQLGDWDAETESEVRDLCVVDVNIVGKHDVGGLVGLNLGRIFSSCCTGTVSGEYWIGIFVGYNIGSISGSYATGALNGHEKIGGLVGLNDGGNVTGCHSTGIVTGSGGSVGGLVGFNSVRFGSPGTITDSNSAGTVTGNGSVGGLIGDNRGAVANSYSVSTVVDTAQSSGFERVGGLVGYNAGGVDNCHSSGEVSGLNLVGGLVGWNRGPLTRCYSTTTVSGGDDIGGLVGSNSEDILACYSTGTVTGHAYVGGLIGNNGSDISYCYSICSVTGNSYVGGLVGSHTGGVTLGGDEIPAFIRDCYSAGVVHSVGIMTGGLVGSNSPWDAGFASNGIVERSFWDIETSGQSDSAGGTGKTTAEMKIASTLLEAGWDFINVWGIGEGQTYPYLRKYSAADVNQDGIVNFLDLCFIAEQWMEEE
ncbi:MAG: hypothetical protein JSU70_18375 [Phycisphaerales bacterium]|nr:MAG: hypothetical protein JSU70_18375 [Phycisphaerales bacterium]